MSDCRVAVVVVNIDGLASFDQERLLRMESDLRTEISKRRILARVTERFGGMLVLRVRFSRDAVEREIRGADLILATVKLFVPERTLVDSSSGEIARGIGSLIDEIVNNPGTRRRVRCLVFERVFSGGWDSESNNGRMNKP